jgi:hypothetical protein
MPAGMPYFAWVEPTETTFEAEHLRWDENIFSFNLAQEEGDPASLTVVVRRPRNEGGDPIGLLGPGRKIWAWFALDCGPDLIRFRGRLVGIPTSLFKELVTLEFIAKPADLVAQKEALAESLRVLPYYDPVVLDPERRTDPEVVLEGYTAIWHYDRETHELTISDEITGEDGLVEFDGTTDAAKVLYDGLGLTLTGGPLTRVDINAEFNWTQSASGGVDLTQYLTSNWPGAVNGAISSYTMTAADWPKPGTGIGDGWQVVNSTARDKFDHNVRSETSGSTLIINYYGDSSRSTVTETRSYCSGPLGFLVAHVVTTDEIRVVHSKEPDGPGDYVSSFSRSYADSSTYIAAQEFQPTLVAGFTAGRPCTEYISFTLFADVQHILTDPEDGEALRIDDIKSVNLSERIGEGTDSYIPMVDSGRRSYIATARGNQSLEHLILLARAHLMKRARVVEITFAPKLSRMPEITLRKNVFLVEPRIGEALGKVIGYSISLDGSDGRINCEIRIGCTIGRGGSAVATDGEPTYCSIDYVGNDYQQFTGRTVLFDSSVGYQPPLAAPNDDGLNLQGNLTAADVIEVPLSVTFGPQEQLDAMGNPIGGGGSGVSGGQEGATAAEQYVRDLMSQFETHAKFKLKSMTRDFASDYQIQLTDLKIPTGYNLEAT